MNNLARAFDRAGSYCWRIRRYDAAMLYWAVYLKLLNEERRAWYGLDR